MLVYVADLTLLAPTSGSPESLARFVSESGADFNQDGLNDIKVTLDLTQWDDLVPLSVVTVAVNTASKDLDGWQLTSLPNAENLNLNDAPLNSALVESELLLKQPYNLVFQFIAPAGDESSRVISFLISKPAQDDIPGEDLSLEMLLDEASWLITVLPVSSLVQSTQVAGFTEDLVNLNAELELTTSKLVKPGSNGGIDPVTGLIVTASQLSFGLEAALGEESSSSSKSVLSWPNLDFVPVELETLPLTKEQRAWYPQLLTEGEVVVRGLYGSTKAAESWELYIDDNMARYAYSSASASGSGTSAHAIAFSGTF